jgi:hypothetical protein
MGLSAVADDDGGGGIAGAVALTVQYSLLCNLAGRASVWCSFILVCFYVFCGLNVLLILPFILK